MGYGVILVVILVLLALFAWWYYRKSGYVHNTQPEIQESVQCRAPRYRQEEYDKVSLDIDIYKGKAKYDGSMTFSKFLEIYQTDEFVESYTNAVDVSYTDKYDLLLKYRQKLASQVSRIKDGPKELDQLSNKAAKDTIAIIDQQLDRLNNRVVTCDTVKGWLKDAVENPEKGIMALTGMGKMKDFLASQLYTFSRNPKVFYTRFQNIALYGPPGVGKTKLAEVIGYVYANSGILLNHVTNVVSKADFTTAYVNESGRLTRKLLLSSIESVVFIDEAYDITPESKLLSDHGQESLAAMINVMNETKGMLVVIVAGYEDAMKERFMGANPGLARRFPHEIVLTGYSALELSEILINFLITTCPDDIEITKDISDYTYSLLEGVLDIYPDAFENQAGDMDNLAGCISEVLYTGEWNWLTDHRDIILIGMNTFLGRKNMAIGAK